MMEKEKPSRLQLTLAISCLSLLWISSALASSVPSASKYSLGIDPKDESYYRPNVIKCRDGSKKFAREQLNDDFCDCPDGTDEPGTSACPQGKFYCKNAGHAPLTIFSSRVNDGICDCCDGSDEYDGTITCQNTCWEAGKAAREKLNKKIKTYQEGVTIRKQEIEKAKQAFARDEEDLSKLKSEEKILKDLVDKLKAHKERIEKAEEEERLRKEQEEKNLKEAERKAKEQEVSSDKVPHGSPVGVNKDSQKQDVPEWPHHSAGDAEKDHGAESELPTAKSDELHVAEEENDGYDDTYKAETSDDSKTEKEASHDDESQKHEGPDDTSGLSKEELGRLVASRWTGENAANTPSETVDTVASEAHKDISDDEGDEEDNGYTSEADDDRHKYEDDDFRDDGDEEYTDDHAGSDESYKPEEEDHDEILDFPDRSSPSWLDKIKQTVQNVLSSFNFFTTPVDLSEADRVRKEYEDSKSKLSKVESRISSLTGKLKHDFGKEKEFYSFYDRCFENKQNKYVYKVCPYKQASQVEGHSTTRLGNWDKFDESYRVMQFSNGERCWNGPDRSIKVRLRCGLTNELTDVDEPSRCEYVALLSTPVLCGEDKLKELQQKLEQMNSKQPQNHDEL